MPEEEQYPEIEGRTTIPRAREAAKGCTACDLHEIGTQIVFGEGAQSAEIVMVGEQPGDEEDIAGAPFVGPAGRVLDEALEEAGIDRRTVYVTNVVKHFKWKPRGKRRLPRSPTRSRSRPAAGWTWSWP